MLPVVRVPLVKVGMGVDDASVMMPVGVEQMGLLQ